MTVRKLIHKRINIEQIDLSKDYIYISDLQFDFYIPWKLCSMKI